MNVKELEGRSRDNNIDIVGRQEGEEKGRPTEFITGIIPEAVWGPATSPSPVVVDCGGGWWWHCPKPRTDHRVSSPGFTSLQDKEMILLLSRQQQVNCNGSLVFCVYHPDYTVEVTVQRSSFREAIRALREWEVKYITPLRLPSN